MREKIVVPIKYAIISNPLFIGKFVYKKINKVFIKIAIVANIFSFIIIG